MLVAGELSQPIGHEHGRVEEDVSLKEWLLPEVSSGCSQSLTHASITLGVSPRHF